jgi:2-polyprenyl-6-methoxyphenol hydroxylase-like FAD-dependent oxidoreductase
VNLRGTWDVAVLGGGPAGAAAARAAARRGARIVPCEPDAERIDKPCGEGIMPAGVSALRCLGLADLARAGRPFERLRFFVAGRIAAEVPLSAAGSSAPSPQSSPRAEGWPES